MGAGISGGLLVTNTAGLKPPTNLSERLVRESERLSASNAQDSSGKELFKLFASLDKGLLPFCSLLYHKSQMKSVQRRETHIGYHMKEAFSLTSN